MGIDDHRGIHFVALLGRKWFKSYLVPREVVAREGDIPFELLNAHRIGILVVLGYLLDLRHLQLHIVKASVLFVLILAAELKRHTALVIGLGLHVFIVLDASDLVLLLRQG